MATLEEMDEYMEFCGPSYRNIPHHAIRIKYGCEVTGFDGVMDVICNRHEIERIATVIPRAKYIGEKGLFGTPGIFNKMGFPRYDTFEFDETSYDKFVSPKDEPEKRVETPFGLMTPDAHGSFEGADQWVVDTMDSQVKPGDTVIDVGANIGYYTRLLSRLVGPNGTVFAFEPDPTNFSVLEKNTADLGNVTIVNKAVSDDTGTGTLSLSKSNLGDHRLYPAGQGRESVEVEITTLDDYFLGDGNTLPPIDFIKVDAQGAEGAVLHGARHLMAASPNLKMLIEYAPKMMKEYGITATEMIHALKAAGLSLTTIRDGGEGISHLMTEYSDDSDKFTDVLFSRNETVALPTLYPALENLVPTEEEGISYEVPIDSKTVSAFNSADACTSTSPLETSSGGAEPA